MASRIIHIAVDLEILKKYDVKDKYKFILGTILPDVGNKMESHKIEYYDRGKKIVYNTCRCREENYDKIKNDDLYLGKYLHILQDLIFRDFIIRDVSCKWKYSKANVKDLYNDYNIINKYVIKKYNIDIKNICDYNLIENIDYIDKSIVKNIYDEIKKDFEEKEDTHFLKFLSKNLIDKYINEATRISINEINAIELNYGYLNPFQYSLKVPTIQYIKMLPRRIYNKLKRELKKILKCVRIIKK